MKKILFLIALMGYSISAMEEKVIVSQENIFTLAKEGDVEKIEALLNEGVSIESRDESGCTLLMHAVEGGSEEAVAWLIDKGANIDEVNNNKSNVYHFLPANKKVLDLFLKLEVKGMHKKNVFGNTPLWLAAYNGYKEIVSYLIESGADVNAKNNQEKSVLYSAAESGFTDVALELLKRGAKVDTAGFILLAVAAKESDTEMLDTFLKAGVPIDVTCNRGWNVLMHLSYLGYEDMVLYLIEKNANVNAKNNSGNTALMKAAAGGRKKVVLDLIKAGACIDEKNKQLETALICAANHGRSEIMVTLIKAGASKDIKDSAGCTPLMKAAEFDYRSAVEEIIKLGVNVHEKNNKGRTALSLAARYGHKELVKLLLGAGSKMNEKDTRGSTPLILAVVNGHMEVIKELIEAGANVYVENRDADILYYFARKSEVRDFIKSHLGSLDKLRSCIIKKKDEDAIELIHENPLVINSPLDIAGNTAFMYAVAQRNFKICKVLLRVGARPEVKNKNGKTALDDLLKGRKFSDLAELFSISDGEDS